MVYCFHFSFQNEKFDNDVLVVKVLAACISSQSKSQSTSFRYRNLNQRFLVYHTPSAAMKQLHKLQ